MTTPTHKVSEEISYYYHDSLSDPVAFARQEWVKLYGEPKTYEEFAECEEYAKSKKLEKKECGCQII